MCGIAGWALLETAAEGAPLTRETLLRMLAIAQHRGPDGAGIFHSAHAGLGSVRLSIIDLASGDQPICNETGTLWIVFNGEIFNYLELRQDLERNGHRFTTQSDTEVILHLFEERGPGCLDGLNGQFALAIWDQPARRLFLARDRTGERPLFYTHNAGKLLFASEIKSLLVCPGVEAHIHAQALRETFTYWSSQPPHTLFEDIFELPPAHFMLVEDGRVEIQRYWSMDFTPDETFTPDEAQEALEALLRDAVRIRLRADVQVGAYLSGGLDSSLIAALALGMQPGRLESFSIGFSDARYDESAYQQQMAEFLGTSHHHFTSNADEIGRVFPQVIWHSETPILRSAPAPMLLLSEQVRQSGIKVVLTGEGADEFLAGYDIFKEMKLRRFWARHPESSQRPRLLERLYPDIDRLHAMDAYLRAFFKQDLLETASPYYSHRLRWKNTARTLRLFADPAGTKTQPEEDLLLPESFSNWPSLGQAQYLEIITFLSPYLLSSQVDRPAMANGVEGRSPFLDVRVIEFCNRLPPMMKMPGLRDKWILRKVGSKFLPDAIWQRAKRPYRAPIQPSFFAGQPPDYVEDLLSETALRSSGFFEPAGVSALLRKARSGQRLSEVDEMAFCGILSTQLLEAQFCHGMHVDMKNDFVDAVRVIESVSR